MKQIIPFKKEIVFKSMITKITSISLENTLELTEESLVSGDFIVSGSYKMTEASQIDEEFSYKIPVEIAIDKKYDCANMSLEIDDFTYEIVDEEKLLVNIALLLDDLELKEVEQEECEEKEACLRESELSYKDLFLDTSIDEALDIDDDKGTNDIAKKLEQEVNKNLELNQIISEVNQQTTSNVGEASSGVTSIFSAFKDTEETFSTYFVYIVREGDSLDKIMAKYKITKEKLEEYNNLNEIKIGDKLIIPSNNA